MKISLYLVSKSSMQEANTSPIVDGDSIEYAGKSYDFSPLPAGASIELGWPFTKPIIRSHEGILEVEIIYLFDDSDIEPDQSPYEHLRTVELTQGTFPCPIKRKHKEVIGNATS